VRGRGAEVLRRVAELGRDPKKTVSAIDGSVWSGHEVLEALAGK